MLPSRMDSAGHLKYRAVWTGISRIAVTGLGKRPPQYTSALNRLVFGSASTVGPPQTW